MRALGLLLPFVCLLPLSAQTWEAGLFLGRQFCQAADVPAGSSNFYYTAARKPDSATVYGLSIGRSVGSVGPFELQFTAAYQPDVTTRVRQESLTSYVFIPPEFDLKTGYAGLGAMFYLKALETVGGGLEYRFEHFGAGSIHDHEARPWLRLKAGLNLPSVPALKPFIGLEASVPLVSSKPGRGPYADGQLVFNAPKAQVGIAGGVRF